MVSDDEWRVKSAEGDRHKEDLWKQILSQCSLYDTGQPKTKTSSRQFYDLTYACKRKCHFLSIRLAIVEKNTANKFCLIQRSWNLNKVNSTIIK